MAMLRAAVASHRLVVVVAHQVAAARQPIHQLHQSLRVLVSNRAFARHLANLHQRALHGMVHANLIVRAPQRFVDEVHHLIDVVNEHQIVDFQRLTPELHQDSGAG